LVGKNQFMTTFNLRVGSESFNEFGDSVLGVINYDRKSLDELEESDISGREITINKGHKGQVLPFAFSGT
jgi:hypothetical protein